MIESLELRIVLTGDDAFVEQVAAIIGPELPSPMAPVPSNNEFELDDRNIVNWRIGRWQDQSNGSARHSTLSVSADPAAYFVWYLHDIPWRESFDVYVTWPAAEDATSQVNFELGGLDAVGTLATSVNQKIAPEGPTHQGTTWQRVGTVIRGPVDFVPYIAMSNAALQGVLQADAIRIVPHSPSSPIQIVGPPSQEFDRYESVSLAAWALPSTLSPSMELAIDVPIGRLRIAEIPLGLQVTGDSRDDSHLILRGTTHQINTALEDMTWHPPDGKQSDVALTMSVHAVDGNVTIADIESRVITLLYRPTESAPDFHAPEELLVDRGISQRINQNWPSSIAISSGAQYDALWELEIASDGGEIDFTELLTGQTVHGIRGSGQLTIVDTAERLDALLRNLVYRPLVSYIHPLEFVLRDPLQRVVHAARSITIVPQDEAMVAGHPGRVAAAEGSQFDLRSLFVVPLPGAVREYRIQSGTSPWNTWDPSVALWPVPAVSATPQKIRVRMQEFETASSTAPRSIAEVVFDIVAPSSHHHPVLKQWNELHRIEAVEDGSVVIQDLAGYVFGPGPLQYQIASVLSHAPRGTPVLAQIVGHELRVTPLSDRFGPATVVINVVGALGVQTSWPVELYVTPVPDPPRSLVTFPTLSLTEDVEMERLEIRSWFDFPDAANGLFSGTISAVSRDPNRLQVIVDGSDLVFIPQPNAFGEVIIDVWSSNPAGESGSVPLTILIAPLPDPTQVVEAIPAVDIHEDSRDVWIPMDRYFRDNDVSDGGLSYSLVTTSGIPVEFRMARDVGGGNYLVVDTIPNATGSGIITIAASDPAGGLPATAIVPVVVRPIDDSPYVTAGFSDVSDLVPGQSISVNLLGHFVDIENSPLSYSVESRGDLLLENLRIENGTEVRFSVRSDLESLPREQVTHVLITATDGSSRAVASFAVRRDANNAPTIQGADEERIFELTANSTGFSHQFTASGNGVKHWKLRSGSPDGVAIDANTGQLTWGQVTNQPGIYFATVDVESEGVLFGRSVVFRVNPSPVGTGQSVVLTKVGFSPFNVSTRFLVDEEQQITLVIQADGPRPHDIRYEIVSGPGTISGMGQYQWTPDDTAVATNQDPQDHTVFVRASDGITSDIKSFGIRVYEINYSPRLTAPSMVQFEPHEIVDVTFDPFVASEQVADLGAAGPYFYDLEASLFMEIDHATGVVSWQPGLESRELGPVTHAVRVSARDQGFAVGYGLSHVLLAGEHCITSQSCHSVWAPMARDLEIELYPGEEIDIDVVDRQLVDDVDGNASSLRMVSAGYIYDGRYVTDMGMTRFTVMAPVNVGGARDIPVRYNVIDNDQLLGNSGEVRVDVINLRPDIDMDLDGNGMIEPADATLLGNINLWNDDYLEEYRLAQVPLHGPAQEMIWGMDGITAEGVPSELDYLLEISQSGTGLVELVDLQGSAIPLSFSLESTNVGGTWYVKGIETGDVNITLTLSLNGEEIAFDQVTVSVYDPPIGAIDVHLEFLNAFDPWIPVASEDDDNDGLPQRAEGYGLIAPPSNDGGIGSPRMKGVRFRISDDVQNVPGVLFVEYDASPPERNVISGPSYGTNGSLPALMEFAPGYLRLWTAAHDARSATPVTMVSAGGHFVSSGPLVVSVVVAG